MNPTLRAAILIVNLALACYTVGTVLQQRGHRATRGVVSWLTAGVIFDIVATLGMIFGTDRSLWTLHGILGYSALTVMVIDTVRIWRHRLSLGDAEVPRGLHLYSRYAYLWWVVAYVTGAALVMMSARHAG
jgi:hypothetical protein